MNIITNVENALLPSPLKSFGQRVITIESDCGSTPMLANLISGYLASVGIKHGYLCNDRTPEAVADKFAVLGFVRNLNLIDLWVPGNGNTFDELKEHVTERQWKAVIIDNPNFADCYISNHVARALGISVFCFANKPRN